MEREEREKGKVFYSEQERRERDISFFLAFFSYPVFYLFFCFSAFFLLQFFRAAAASRARLRHKEREREKERGNSRRKGTLFFLACHTDLKVLRFFPLQEIFSFSFFLSLLPLSAHLIRQQKIPLVPQHPVRHAHPEPAPLQEQPRPPRPRRTPKTRCPT